MINIFRKKQQNYCRKLCTSFLIVLVLNTKAQTGDSEIFGVNPLSADGLSPNLVDRDWSILPSEQGRNIDLWGRESRRTNDSLEVSTLTTIESNDDLADPPNDPNDLNDDDDGPTPPPDDPVDIPLDGGTSILIAVAVAKGYQKNRNRKTVSKKME